MRIGFLGPALPFRGGIAEFANQLAKEIKQDHEIRFFSFKKQYPKILFPGKDQFSSSKDPEFNVTSKLIPYNPFTWRRSLNDINLWEPDILIVSYWIPFFAPAFGYILKRLNKRIQISYIIHNIDFHEKWIFGKSLTRYALKQADILITLSSSVYNETNELFPNKKIIKGFHPVYNCYNNNKYSNKSAKANLDLSGKKVILFFGYIKPYKGLELLIRSLPKVNKVIENIHLLIVGEIYGNSSKYHEVIKDSGLAEKITLIDRFVKDEEIELYFKAADVLVLPYLQATQSGVLQIANDMGLGSVVTPVGSLPDLVVDSKTGIITEDISAQDVSKGIIDFFKLDRKEIQKNIKEEKSKYSWKALTELILT